MSQLEDLGRVKGSTMVPIVTWARQELGPEAFAARVQAISPAVADRIAPLEDDLGLVSGVWYPAQIIHAILDEIVFAETDATERDRRARASAAAAYQTMMSGLHKAVFRLFVSPRTYARHIQRLWSLNFDNGIIEVEEVAPGHQRNVIREWRSYHHGMLTVNNHYKSKIFELIGCHNVRFDIEPCENGRELVVTNTYWDA